MVLMKILHYIIVLSHNHAQKTSSLVVMEDVSIRYVTFIILYITEYNMCLCYYRDGNVITIMIAEMVRMKEKNVTQNTRHVHLMNSPVRTSSVFAISTAAMVKTIVEIIQMKLIAVRIKWFRFVT